MKDPENLRRSCFKPTIIKCRNS